MKNFNELNLLELDTIREIGSIGTGNAATALSAILNQEVHITLPDVQIMDYNQAIDWIGGPETITAGVLVRLGGEINGIMLSVQQLSFLNLILDSMHMQPVADYEHLSELEVSALVEVGNIIISTFINALSADQIRQQDVQNRPRSADNDRPCHIAPHQFIYFGCCSADHQNRSHKNKYDKCKQNRCQQTEPERDGRYLRCCFILFSAQRLCKGTCAAHAEKIRDCREHQKNRGGHRHRRSLCRIVQ